MSDLKTELVREKKELETLIEKIHTELAGLPAYPGVSLQVRTTDGQPRYYLRKHVGGEIEEEYCSLRRQSALIHDLAQTEYLHKLLSKAESQHALLDRFLKSYELTATAEVLSALNPGRRKLIKPLVPDLSEYLHTWDHYKGNPDFPLPDEDHPFTTEAGENVRSKSEKIIADKYGYLSLPYVYEPSLTLMDRNRPVTVHPDFGVVSRRTLRFYYHEHLGMMDHPDYAAHALRKLQLYMANGIFPGEQLLLTFETSKMPLTDEQLMRMIHHYLL